MFEAVQTLKAEYAELERQLADPELHSDQGNARTVGKRYAALAPVVRTYDEWLRTADDIEAARELAHEDPAFAEEATKLEHRREELAEKLQVLLVPRDPSDDKDAILEIKAGEGGDESALFAGDLLRMYLKYAESQNWKTEVLDAAESDLGGYKSITVAVKAKGTPEPGEAPFALLKFEGGVHRVQRVPVTESQGRIHTSAAGVLVLPEAEDVDVEIDPNDLRIDVFRSSGPGCSPWPRRRRVRMRAMLVVCRCARSTARSGSAPTTTPRTGSPTTAPATSPTTSTRCWTATSSPSSTPAPRPTWPHDSTHSRPERW